KTRLTKNRIHTSIGSHVALDCDTVVTRSSRHCPARRPLEPPCPLCVRSRDGATSIRQSKAWIQQSSRRPSGVLNSPRSSKIPRSKARNAVRLRKPPLDQEDALTCGT